MVKIQAAEAKISCILVHSMSPALKLQDPKFPIMQLNNLFSLAHPCLINAHIFQNTCPKFITQVLDSFGFFWNLLI